jgi:hypothetical protein
MSDWHWPGEAQRKDFSQKTKTELREIAKQYNAASDIELDINLPNPKQRVNYYAD